MLPVTNSSGRYANALDNSNARLFKAGEQMASGKRINSAKDDAAGLAVASVLISQMGGYLQSQSNISDGMSLLQTADAGLAESSKAVGRMRELAMQSANGTLNDSDRKALQYEYSELSKQVDAISKQANFNGKQLLDGTLTTTIQTGPNAGPENSKTLSIDSATPAALGINGTDISSQAGARAALDALDGAGKRIAATRASIGGAASGLEAQLGMAQKSFETTAAALSSIQDTDYAAASASAASAQVSQAAALAALKSYQNIQSMTVTSLLQAR
ncbi:MAG TPA: flagellin [Rhodocyclaceae bacterium]|nr:flagellin [Rhodocyclaceae bacterium]